MMPFYTETIGLIGIDSGHMTVSSPVVDAEDKQLKALTIRQNTGVAIVVPTAKIGELLDEEVFMAQRKDVALKVSDNPMG